MLMCSVPGPYLPALTWVPRTDMGKLSLNSAESPSVRLVHPSLLLPDFVLSTHEGWAGRPQSWEFRNRLDNATTGDKRDT